MKLLTQTSVYFLIIFSFILILGGFIFYNGLKRILYLQIDEGLLTETSIIEEEIRHSEDIPDYTVRFSHEIEVFLYNHKVKPYHSISDTAIFNNKQHLFYSFRSLYRKGNASGHGYSIHILHPLDETQNLIQNIIQVLLIMLFFVLLSLLVFNFIISQKIWKPFYNTIYQIRHYDAKTRHQLDLVSSNISEFDTLNKVLNKMANKIQRDFVNLKEFTENASHEIQTPLAIIQSKLEVLVQSDNLTREQINSVQSINHAISRLSKLNSGLLLITKIENDQFDKTDAISIHEVIQNSVVALEDFINYKKIKVIWNMNDSILVQMNSSLCDVLVNNLINNAIKHNLYEGYISISILKDELIVENSGSALSNIDRPADLFQRFKKDSTSKESIGLGLAIVKKICDTYHFSVSYTVNNNIHSISIKFS